MMISRRSMLGFLAAPAIVRAASLMPVKALAPGFFALPDNMTMTEVLQRFEALRGKHGHYERMWQEIAESLINPPLLVGERLITKFDLRPGAVWGRDNIVEGDIRPLVRVA